jgi:hypothetical protein
MTSAGRASACLLIAAITVGTFVDRPKETPRLALGGYQVLAADFHVHTFPFSASVLAPWDVVIEAGRQGLDAIAVTGHDQVISGKIARRFSQWIGGPTVLVGEEIHSPHYHLIAAGIHSTISWRRTAAQAIREVHAQGGVAIAAHPVAEFWPGYDADAVRMLDGSEVCQPVGFWGEDRVAQLREFYERTPRAAIGSSDYHGPGPLGVCRTYVFAAADTEDAILDAIRLHRTVVFDRGREYGDAEFIRLARQDPRLEQESLAKPESGLLVLFSRIAGALGLLLALCCGFGRL